ncbi:hypothetical protein [Halomonas sp.]|uniref:hypothetical protein n=1 Tax=Halomonas sp. TaxID=1486246 RepID=UPI00298E452E|nr:hypothetical protein [Halomonas sp.]MDW7746681.1 hypothetical protein [Halomonas sp.]
MPVSKKRRRKARKKKHQPRSSPKFEYSRFALREEQHEDFKKAVLEAAKKSVSDFPNTLKSLNGELRKSDPIGILATLSYYGLQAPVSQSEGVEQRSQLSGISQHHIELLQALVLAIPVEDWPKDPFTPDVIQRVVDTLPKVTETFFHQRILATESIDDEVELKLLSLQERMRFHTQAIRNWGYFSEVVRISTELFTPLDQAINKHFGFCASDLIFVMKAVVDEYERRHNEHWSTMKKVFNEPTVGRMVEAYYDNVPELESSPDELLSALPVNITHEGVMSLIMGHFDQRLSLRATFTPDEVSALTGIDVISVAAALRAISLSPGSLAETKIEHLFLGNPVWEAPGIDIGDVFFLPIPQMFFSHIHRIMERLATEVGLKGELDNQRSAFLENQLLQVIKQGLPGAKLTPSAKWKQGCEQFETDLLAIIDRTVLIAEAKSNRLTASGLRGAPERVKRHVEDIVVYPSFQSARLESLITEARKGDTEADTIVRQLGIDPQIVDQVIRVSVTLDDFSVLSSSESDFKEIGWVPEDHQLAPTILIADLICITDILDNPLLLLHYLSERIHLQKSFSLLGDELDFLGLYLETGFNIAGLRKENSIFSPSGMSKQLDRYYTSKDAGIDFSKPKAKLRPLFSKTIQKLNDRRSHGWTTAGLHLLSVGDPDEQKTIETKLTKLRHLVRRNHHDPLHHCSLQVRPPENRKAMVVFYLFPEVLRASSKKTMEKLAEQALDVDDSLKAVVVFGRSTERFEEPYEVILIATQV